MTPTPFLSTPFLCGNWEKGENEPTDRFYPAIIAFLGYEPWEELVILGEQLREARRRRGLSAKRARRLAPLMKEPGGAGNEESNPYTTTDAEGSSPRS